MRGWARGEEVGRESNASMNGFIYGKLEFVKASFPKLFSSGVSRYRSIQVDETKIPGRGA